MKDDLQKWLDLDIELIEEKPLTDIQTKKIKQAVLGIPKRKKRRMKTWMTVAVAGVMIMATSYFTLPSIASQLPFIKNIVTFIDQDFIPRNYKELSTVIGDIQSSNGIDMMIESAVYDGTNVFITFALNTTYDLGEHPMAGNMPVLKNAKASSIASTSSLKKIEETTYIGFQEITPHFDKEAPQELIVQWKPDFVTNGETGLPFEGDWSFEFKIPMLETTTKTLTESSEHDAGKLTIKSITYSDLTAVLNYEFQIAPSVLAQWPISMIRIMEATDNFGNTYNLHGGSGIVSEDGHGHDFTVSLYTLPEDITSLTFTPVIEYVEDSGITAKTEKMESITIQIQEDPTN